MWSLVEKNPKRDGGAWKTSYKGRFMRIFKNSKNHVFLNQNGEHIVGNLIHLNKNKRKTTQNWSKLNGISTNYVLQYVKYFTIYYIKYVCPRIWVSRYMLKILDENQWKKFQLQKPNNKKFFSCLNWEEKKRILGHKY
jgi:hypothetical protein